MAATYLTPGVYVEEVPSSSATLSPGATAVAAFVGFTAKVPSKKPYEPLLVTNWTQYEEHYGGFVKGAMLPHSVYGFFNEGGTMAYIVPVPHTAPSTESGTLELESGDRSLGKPITFSTSEPNADITLVITAEPEPEDPSKAGDPPTYEIDVLEGDKSVEKHSGVTVAKLDSALKSSTKVAVAVETDKISQLEADLQTLQTGVFAIQPAVGSAVAVPAREFSGSASARTGISGLTIADEVTMVMVPDLVTAARKEDGGVDEKLWKSVQLALINHCEGQKNRMAILDAPPDLTPQGVKNWLEEDAMYSSPYATLYYPWIEVANQGATNGDATEIMVPPSGHIAGIWSRTDETRGVWKAPANEPVRSALKVEKDITKAEQGLLNPIGINCIRAFGTQGIRVWGARTLAPTDEWKYINVRRLFNMIETTIMDGTQYAVFEPNDEVLWEGLKRTVGAFLRGLWRDGALFGATAEQAFFVKCDEENNPQESRDQGRVVVEVGVAPVTPAEFVIFRISQKKDES